MNRQDYKRIIPGLRFADVENNVRICRTYKVRGKRRVRKAIICAAAIALLLVLGACENRTDSTADSIVLTAYAGGAQSALTASYQSDTLPTALKPNVSVALPEYSPLTSSVPGIPFKVELKRNDKSPEIEIRASDGNIVTWNEPGGTVKNRGRSYACHSGDTIYWTPLDSGRIAETGAVITFSLVVKGQEICTQTLKISASDDQYTATAIGTNSSNR